MVWCFHLCGQRTIYRCCHLSFDLGLFVSINIVFIFWSIAMCAFIHRDFVLRRLFSSAAIILPSGKQLLPSTNARSGKWMELHDKLLKLMSCNLLKYFEFVCALQCLSSHIVERCFASFVRAALSLHRRLVAMFRNDIHELHLLLTLFACPLTKRSAKSLCGTCRLERESPQPKQIIHRHSNTPGNSGKLWTSRILKTLKIQKTETSKTWISWHLQIPESARAELSRIARVQPRQPRSGGARPALAP